MLNKGATGVKGLLRLLRFSTGFVERVENENSNARRLGDPQINAK
jgi:hypothetical protein